MKAKLFFLITSLFFLMTVTGCSDYGKKVVFGNVTIYYTHGIAEAEANVLGKYLIRSGFDNNGERKTIQFVKSGETYQVRVVVKKGIEQDQEYIDTFKELATVLSIECFSNEPVEIHACDDHLNTLRVCLMNETEQI